MVYNDRMLRAFDPSFYDLVPRDAALERVATGFAFTEGPVWMPDGHLLFSDIPNNVIRRLAPDGSVSIFREKSGCTEGCVEWHNAGSNGLTLDRQGRLLICQHGNRQLVRLEQDGTLTVLASHYEGQRLNSPNDVVVHSSGAIYFTDPPYGLKAQDEDRSKQLRFNGVYRLVEGELRLLTRRLRRPNGLAFSPDERFLYVANSEDYDKLWWRFPVKEDGSLGDGEVFCDLTVAAGNGVPDGFRLDQKGNLFATGPGGIVVISPQGRHLGTIRCPEVTANCVFGGEDRQTLYVTATTSVYRVRLRTAGAV